MISEWRLIAANARTVLESEDIAADLRDKAAYTLDLLQLVATWPLPPGLRIEDELALSLFALCQKTGMALCAERCRPTPPCDRLPQPAAICHIPLALPRP